MKKKTKKETVSKNLVWHSHSDILAKDMKSKSFRNAYHEEIVRQQLAEQISKARKTKKMTQKAVAEKADMPQSVVARIESGNHSVSMDTVGRIAHVLGKKVQLV